jgi:uncharacterized membrane protein
VEARLLRLGQGTHARDAEATFSLHAMGRTISSSSAGIASTSDLLLVLAMGEAIIKLLLLLSMTSIGLITAVIVFFGPAWLVVAVRRLSC